ncbi:MAG: DUF3298 domain-containing protein [Kiritimatiellia bacterium]
MKSTVWFCAIAAAMAAGCATEYVQEREKSEEFALYLDCCREILLEVGGDGYIPKTATTWESASTYEIVYADARYVSYRAEEYEYLGGAHGNTTITVLTIDRKTGRELKLEDFIPKEKHEALLRALREGAVRKLGGEYPLLNEVEITDNFYLAEDGLHFIYNRYEIAPYAAGAIEVVIPLEGGRPGGSGVPTAGGRRGLRPAKPE